MMWLLPLPALYFVLCIIMYGFFEVKIYYMPEANSPRVVAVAMIYVIIFMASVIGTFIGFVYGGEDDE